MLCHIIGIADADWMNLNRDCERTKHEHTAIKGAHRCRSNGPDSNQIEKSLLFPSVGDPDESCLG